MAPDALIYNELVDEVSTLANKRFERPAQERKGDGNDDYLTHSVANRIAPIGAAIREMSPERIQYEGSSYEKVLDHRRASIKRKS